MFITAFFSILLFFTVKAFYFVINVVVPPREACMISMTQGLCKAFYEARSRTIAFFNFIVVFLVLAFIISLTLFYIEARNWDNK